MDAFYNGTTFVLVTAGPLYLLYLSKYRRESYRKTLENEVEEYKERKTMENETERDKAPSD